jgi:hypothetical protein
MPIKPIAHAIYKLKITAERSGIYGTAEVQVLLLEVNKVLAKSEPVSIPYDNAYTHAKSHQYKINIETRKIKKNTQYFLKLCKTARSDALFAINNIKYTLVEKKKRFKRIENKVLKFDTSKKQSLPKQKRPMSKQNKDALAIDTNQIPKISVISYGAGEYIRRFLKAAKGIVYPNYEIIVGYDGYNEYDGYVKDIPNVKLRKVSFEESPQFVQNVLAQKANGEFILFVKEPQSISPFVLFNMPSDLRQHKVVYRQVEDKCQYVFIRREDYFDLDNIMPKECEEVGNIKYDLSFVTCTNNIVQYTRYVATSLLNNQTTKNYEILPVLNFGNRYSAAEALNLGMDRARGDIIVACHQDVVFYNNWIETLFLRIEGIEKLEGEWGVLGTAGITKKERAIGRVHNIKGKSQWEGEKRAKFGKIQTADEHCVILRKSSGLRFDEEVFDGFHMYAVDLCLLSLDRGFINYGILCPLTHISKASSMLTGKEVFMEYLSLLNKKWRKKFKRIRMPFAVIEKGKILNMSLCFKNIGG